MMKIKLILIVLSVFVLTGCSEFYSGYSKLEANVLCHPLTDEAYFTKHRFIFFSTTKRAPTADIICEH